MEKLPYDDLMNLTDPLWEAALADFAEIYSRMHPVDVLHTRPPLKELSADPVLRAAWIGPNATAREARNAALAPLYAEHDARQARLHADLDATYAASGWTEPEVRAEIEARCDASLRAGGHFS